MKKYKIKTWQHVKAVAEVQKCELFGVNVFDYKWKDTNKKVTIPDYLYNESKVFSIYQIEVDDTIFEFDCVELSMCVYGFCIQKY